LDKMNLKNIVTLGIVIPVTSTAVAAVFKNKGEFIMGRIFNQRQRIIFYLAKMPRFNHFFTDNGILQYNARIKQLRDAGIDIPKPKKIRDGVYQYKLNTPLHHIDMKTCTLRKDLS